MYQPLKRPTKTSIAPLYKTCLAALITASLTACGGGSSGSDDEIASAPEQPETPETPETPDTPDTPTVGGDNDGNVSLVGTIGFNDDDVFGTFISLPTPIPVPTVTTATDLFPDLDTCEVTTFDPDTFFGPDDPDPDPDDTDTPEPESISVSAGEVLTVISPAGTFAELIRFQSGDDIDYELADGASLPGPVPAGTVVNIPGDVFPAFTGVAVPAASDLANFSPSSLPISVSDEFSWVPPSGSVTTFVFLSITGNFSPVNNSFTTVTCTLIDDGSFTFPADIQAELGSDFEAISVAAGRSGVNVVIQGNAAVITFATSANEVISIDF